MITIYSNSPRCAPCRNLKTLLQANNLMHKVKIIEMEGNEDLFKEKLIKFVPTIFFGEKKEPFHNLTIDKIKKYDIQIQD